jgi:outer membrane receptor protein involved in Fe transport
MLLAGAMVEAATIRGVVTDSSGAPVVATKVVVRHVATGQALAVDTGPNGDFEADVSSIGTYLISVTREGFSEAAETVTVERADQVFDVPLTLEVGSVTTAVVVTPARATRDTKRIPLHVDTVTRTAVEQTNQTSTGDALTLAANITPVGNGPFGVRPRLRGLDSTRLLVLVDGERLNTARQATERTGAEVGLVSPDTISRLEVVNGAGTLMYGSDALAGTINIVTSEASFTPELQWLYGFNGFFSSNEIGRRGTGTVGLTSPRATFRLQAGAEHYDNYKAGSLDLEDTRPFFASGALDRADTIDDAFGFNFNAFPDPFNAPYVRADNEVLNSQARGHFVNASSLIRVGERRSVRLRYQRRRMKEVGFPDFAEPYFFNATSLPFSTLDRASARYEAQAVTPWLANLSLTAYYQRTTRLLQNTLPVQFPSPTPVVLFPISVLHLDVRSETEQRVWTPGVEFQATLQPLANHLLTTGLTVYRDRSSDQRVTSTQTSMVGQVVLGQRGPTPVVFPTAVPLGLPVVANPVRVPDASFRDIAVFAQDEWRIRSNLSVVAGLRGDFFRVTTNATPGYEVASLIAGARPPFNPSTLPDVGGATYTRRSLTGDVGLVTNQGGWLSPFIRFGRSYRHPNLEEMLFAGPATVGSIVPNVQVKPETGQNFDTGAKFAIGRVSGGVYVFVNRYQNFIAQDLVVATSPSGGALAQTTNYADVRIGGVEFAADAPIVLARGVITLSTSGAFTRGTITDGVNPLNGEALDGTPADNITPARVLAGARYTEPGNRWWVEYGLRAQAEVSRVAQAVVDSPFLIAQDLLSLDGFAVQRIGWGITLTRGRDRVALTVGIENLTNKYYREHFQFAPARGRSLTIGVHAGAF